MYIFQWVLWYTHVAAIDHLKGTCFKIRWGNIATWDLRCMYLSFCTSVVKLLCVFPSTFITCSRNKITLQKCSKQGFWCTRHHPLLWTLDTCYIACTQCIMTPVTWYCILTSAPRSNSIFKHSSCPFCEATINAVHPSCNDKCKYLCVNHQ